MKPLARRVDVDFTLNAVTSSGWGGLFDIDVRTTNDPLSLFFQDSPADSTLRLVGHTTNGKIRAELHRAFEGHFRAATTNHPAGFHRPYVEDPKGEGRARTIDSLWWSEDGTSMHGDVHWDEGKDNLGSATFYTTNARIFLGI
jgi:hypothetical protein